MDEAMKLGADFVATGHYCRKEVMDVDGRPVYRLLAGSDHNKDQSYFLCQLSQKQLEKALFPIGDLEKPEVRRIAAELKLVTAHKKDSQGICFVGKVDLPVFLQQKLQAKKGKVYLIPTDCSLYSREPKGDLTLLSDSELDVLATSYPHTPAMGKVIGDHNGAHFYTIGQRKGLNIGGFPEPLFVIGIDVVENAVYTGMGQDHPGLFRRVLKVDHDEVHWVRPDLAMQLGEKRRFDIRIRYRQPLQGGVALMREGGLYVIFDEAQRGITPGQFAALYDGEELIASGAII
jgi:tRNA-specific 2-thiouridylase